MDRRTPVLPLYRRIGHRYDAGRRERLPHLDFDFSFAPDCLTAYAGPAGSLEEGQELGEISFIFNLPYEASD